MVAPRTAKTAAKIPLVYKSRVLESLLRIASKLLQSFLLKKIFKTIPIILPKATQNTIMPKASLGKSGSPRAPIPVILILAKDISMVALPITERRRPLHGAPRSLIMASMGIKIDMVGPRDTSSVAFGNFGLFALGN